MKDEKTQTCPLCQNNNARYVSVDHRNCKYFFCPHCTEFQISVGAERRLANSISQWHAQLSEMARNGNDEEILVVTLPVAGQEKEAIANAVLHAEFVLRAKLLH